MRISESRFRITDEVKQAAKLRAEAEARRVIQEAELVHRARAEAKAKAKAEIGMLAAAARAAAKAKAEVTAAEEARIDATGKDEWFYLQNQEQFGPVTLEELRAKVSDPELQPPVNLVWAEGMEIWRPVYEVRRVCDPEGAYDLSALTGGLQPEEMVMDEHPEAQDSKLLDLRDLPLPSRNDIESPARAEWEARVRASAEAKVMEEEKLRVGAEARAAEQERLRRISEEKSAEEVRVLTEALAKAREEAVRREIAEAQAREEARLREVAEATMRVEARRRAAAEAKAAEDERIAAVAKARAEEEAKAKRLIEERAARDAREMALAEARIQEETRRRELAEAKAAEESRLAAAARQNAEREAREKARIEAKAAEDARLAALAMARAEEEAKLRREAEARAAEEGRQAAIAKVRAESEMKAKAELEAKAAEEARKAELASARAAEEARLRQEIEARAGRDAALAAEAARIAAVEKMVPQETLRATPQYEERPSDAVPVRAADPESGRLVSPRAKAMDSQDEEAILNAEIDALAEQELKLAELARERAEKEARARAEFKSRASQAARAVIVTKRKVRRQILARSMESERIRALEEAASALMDEVRGDHAEPSAAPVLVTPEEPPVEPAVPIEPAVAIEPETAPEPVAVVALAADPEPPVRPVESDLVRKPPGRRHSFLSGKRSWFYTSEGERVGPVSFEELKDMAEQGTLNPRLDLVWKKGNAEWLPAGRIDGLFSHPVETQRMPAAAAPKMTAPLKPRPKRAVPGKDHLWPGVRRRGMFLVALVLPFVWELMLPLVRPTLMGRFGGVLADRLLAMAAWVPLLIILHFGWRRLANLGMSRWWYLAVFAPLVNLWLGYRCFACPEGYAVHRRMDFAGVLLACAYWMLMAAVITNLIGVSPPWLTWLAPAEFPQQIGKAIQQVQAFARR